MMVLGAYQVTILNNCIQSTAKALFAQPLNNNNPHDRFGITVGAQVSLNRLQVRMMLDVLAIDLLDISFNDGPVVSHHVFLN